jgi:hypothetical protein
LINPEKVGERLERRAQLAEAGRTRRLFFIIVTLSVLDAREPGS